MRVLKLVVALAAVGLVAGCFPTGPAYEGTPAPSSEPRIVPGQVPNVSYQTDYSFKVEAGYVDQSSEDRDGNDSYDVTLLRAVVGNGGSYANGSLQKDRIRPLPMLGETSHVETNDQVEGSGRLVDLGLQPLLASCSLPVNVLEAVPRLVITHTDGAHRILEDPLSGFGLAEGLF